MSRPPAGARRELRGRSEPLSDRRSRIPARGGRQLSDLSRMVHRARLYRSGGRDAADLGIRVRLFREHRRLLAQPLPRDPRRQPGRTGHRRPEDHQLHHRPQFHRRDGDHRRLGAHDRRGHRLAARPAPDRGGRVRIGFRRRLRRLLAADAVVSLPLRAAIAALLARDAVGTGQSRQGLGASLGVEPGIWRQGDLCGRHRRPGRVFPCRSPDQKRRDGAERGRHRGRASDQ